MTTGLDFEGPELNPVPIPEVPSAFQPNPWGFLEFIDPIGDAQMLAFQVSQLTVGMGELLRRIEALEASNSVLLGFHMERDIQHGG